MHNLTTSLHVTVHCGILVPSMTLLHSRKLLQADIYHSGMAFGNVLLGLRHHLRGRAPWTKALAVLGKRGIPPRLQYLRHRSLDQAVDDTEEAERQSNMTRPQKLCKLSGLSI
jgi:hypothetical protein